LPTSAATHLELLAILQIMERCLQHTVAQARAVAQLARNAQLLELSVIRNPFLGDGCAPSVHVATTALYIDGIIRSAVPTAKAAALTGSLRQASLIVRLGDEEVDGEGDGLANVRRTSRLVVVGVFDSEDGLGGLT
jgi:hypothetical protein